MRRVGILERRLEVTDVKRGPTIQQFTVKLPRGMKFNILVNQTTNIQAELGVEGVSVTQGAQPGTAAFLFPRASREIVWLTPIIESEAFQTYRKEHDLAFVSGVDIIGQPMFDSLARFHYALVTDAKGGGKTEFTMGMLYTLLSYNSPDILQVTIIDPKRIDFSFFNIGFPHITGVITDTEEAIETLEGLTDEMEKRYKQLEKAGVRSPKAYREKTKQPMPYRLVLVDEYADLVMQDGSVEDFIVRLGQKARACGIFVILCTQRLSADIVTGKIKANFLTRFCFNLPVPSDYATVFGKQMNPCLLGKGDGLAMIEGKNGYIRFQSPLLADNEAELEKKLAELRDRWVNETKQEEKEQEEQLNRLLYYIEQTGETRIREI
jgi:S-DNA-T family DNA segregation ATPase FtsK/SpoIIIE